MGEEFHKIKHHTQTPVNLPAWQFGTGTGFSFHLYLLCNMSMYY